MKAIEMDAFDEQNGPDEFRIWRVRIAFHGERNCMIQGKS